MKRIELWAVNLAGSVGELRRTQLLEEFRNHHLNIQLFPAVYGKGIKIESIPGGRFQLLQYYYHLNQPLFTLYDNTERLNKQPMSRGELGCAWSQQLLYSQLINDDEHEAYFIFEDDVQFCEPLDIFLEYLVNLPSLDTFDICTFAKDIMWYPLEFTQSINSHYTHIKRQFFNGAYAYIVTKRGASRLLDYCQHQINLPADDLLSNSFVNQRTLVIAPKQPLFQVRKGVESSIDQADQGESIKRAN